MFSLTPSNEYYLYEGPTDMRKGFDGLCGIVQSRMQRNPSSGAVYIFINQRRDRIKLLHWESGGFVLYYKRLESGTYELPVYDGVCYRIGWQDLNLMVEGISMKHIRRRKRFEKSTL